FQAEDGIRDLIVTGVQTCALPIFIFIAIATAVLGGIGYAASSDVSAADRSALDSKQLGLLAIQEGGRRKPVDTFAKETVIRITRSEERRVGKECRTRGAGDK